MRHWFLSYHSPDEALAERLKAAIEHKDEGATVFFAAASLRVGRRWAPALAEAIAEVGEDPVQLGLVASLARPGGNATGINFFLQEVVAKRLRLLHELVPKAIRVAVLVNPANAPVAETTLREVVARSEGIRPHHRAANPDPRRHEGRRDRCSLCDPCTRAPDALFVAPDGFFASRRVQIATLTARDKIPASYGNRDDVAAGGL